MTHVDLVHRAKSPREAILLLAHALDEMSERIETLQSGGWESWGEEPEVQDWDSDEAHIATQRSLEDMAREAAEFTSLVNSDSLTVELKPPSPEKMEARRMFERQQLKLSMVLGDDTDWNEAYAKGGPLWLYNGNRDLVMSYPEPARQAMVQDVLEDDPERAHLMSIDVLKRASAEADLENGAGALAVGTIGGRK